ncbi:hypothetical protein ABTF16_20365, partial [Acinetobacter baumannii]
MKSIDEIKAQEVCVAILLDKKATNTQAKILPSENIIIDRLLERKVELQHAYSELYSKLGKYHQALTNFLDLLVEITSMHSPEEVIKSRAAQKKLNEINQQISIKAHE